MNREDRSRGMTKDRWTDTCKGIPKFLCKVLTMKFVLQVIASIAVLYYITSYIHGATYIWQCTTLAESIRPVERRSCPVVPVSPVPNTTPAPVASNKPPKIGLLMVYDKKYGMPDKDLVPRLIKNREHYCQKHGCTVISTPEPDDASTKHARPPAWNKLLAMKKQLETGLYDYVFYVDMDMVIMNPEISPQSLLNQAPPGQDFILTNDWSGLNTGIIFARNTDFSKTFLQLAWDQEQLVQKYSANGVPHPFEYEQRAFHYLMNTPLWQARGLPQYQGDYLENRKHFTTLPQCSMNSYVLHPLEFRADREVSQYVESDFVVHLAGKKGQTKMDFTKYYLSLAEEEYH